MNRVVESDPATQTAPAVQILAQELRQRLSASSVVRERESLARRTTLRVGGSADLLVEPASESDLSIVLQEAARLSVSWMVLGRGSNLIVRDGGVRGLVISLCHAGFCRIEVAHPRLKCGAGVRLKDLTQEARRHGLAGLEFLAGIPGTVGGALRMNAGAWNGMTFERLESVRYMEPTGVVQEVPAESVPVSYRRCELFRNHIALGATFTGQPSTPTEVEARLNLLNQRRWSTQPAAPSAGCIFKNPLTVPAGRLIEELGLKGARVGGAVVSTVHGNFIVNEGTATAADVLSLIDLIRSTARTVRGIDLETEVEIVGEENR